VRDLASELAKSRTTRGAFGLALHAVQSLLNDDAIGFLVRVRGEHALQVERCTGSIGIATAVLRARTFTPPAALRYGQRWAAFGAGLWDLFPETMPAIGSVVCAPIRSSARLIAGLGVAKQADAPFGFADIALVDTVALVLESAIERRRVG
jgi:GAF domain-containing protein